MKMGRTALFLLLALSVSLAESSKGQQSSSPRDEEIRTKAQRIHERAITLDTHVDISPQYATPELDPGSEKSTLKCDLVKMEKGGLKGVFLAVFVAQRSELAEQGYKAAHNAAMAKFAAIHRLTQKMYPDRCELARSPADVERIAPTGKRIVMIGIENAYPIGDDISRVKEFYDLGARYITLSHSGHNQICDSSGPKQPLNNGLTDFGKRVVAEMNRLGIMVDVSHIAERSFWDVVAFTKAPVIASHSACAALNPISRNLTDDQLRALANNGGVIQVIPMAAFLKADSPERQQAIESLRKELGLRRFSREELPKLTDKERADFEAKRKDYEERMKAIDAKHPPATLVEFVNHIDHAVRTAGIDHVGVGTDFDGGGGVSGFNDESQALNVTIELVRRGYSETDIGKIWGGNLLRVWREVERVAAR